MRTPASPPPAEWAAAVESALDRLQAVWAGPQEADDVPVSPSQLRALTVVEAHGQINLAGLAGQMGTIPSSASRLCDRLQAAGLLERDLSPISRREVVLRLSPQGADLLARLRQARIAALTRILAGMDPAAQRALVTGLTALAQTASALVDAPAEGTTRPG